MSVMAQTLGTRSNRRNKVKQMIKIDFTINGFSDALHLSDNHGLSIAEVEAMKQARYDKWRDFIDNPPPAIIDEPVEE